VILGDKCRFCSFMNETKLFILRAVVKVFHGIIGSNHRTCGQRIEAFHISLDDFVGRRSGREISLLMSVFRDIRTLGIAVIVITMEKEGDYV